MINPQMWNYTPVKNTRDKGCYEFHVVFDWLEMILIEHENTARETADKTRQQCNINTLLFMSKCIIVSIVTVFSPLPQNCHMYCWRKHSVNMLKAASRRWRSSVSNLWSSAVTETETCSGRRNRSVAQCSMQSLIICSDRNRDMQWKEK